MSIDEREIASIFAAAAERAKDKGAPMAGLLTPEEAWALLEAGAIDLVDTRTRAERDLVGYVPGSKPIEWYDYPAKARNARFLDELRDSGARRPPGRVPLPQRCAVASRGRARGAERLRERVQRARGLRGRQERGGPAPRERLADGRPALAPGLAALSRPAAIPAASATRGRRCRRGSIPPASCGRPLRQRLRDGARGFFLRQAELARDVGHLPLSEDLRQHVGRDRLVLARCRSRIVLAVPPPTAACAARVRRVRRCVAGAATRSRSPRRCRRRPFRQVRRLAGADRWTRRPSAHPASRRAIPWRTSHRRDGA